MSIRRKSVKALRFGSYFIVIDFKLLCKIRPVDAAIGP